MLSLMAGSFFERSPMLIFPLIALCLFIAVFCAILWRTVRTSRAELDRAAHMPLADSPIGARSDGGGRG